MIRAAYALLDCGSFFTVGEGEVRGIECEFIRPRERERIQHASDRQTASRAKGLCSQGRRCHELSVSGCDTLEGESGTLGLGDVDIMDFCFGCDLPRRSLE